MSNNSDFCKKAISSEKLGKQIFGALLQRRPKSIIVFIGLAVLSMLVSILIMPKEPKLVFCIRGVNIAPGLVLVGFNLVVWLTIKVCRTLINVFSLRKNEIGITWCYISILLAFGLWTIGFLLLFEINENVKVAGALGVLGTVLSVIFRERIEGVATFFHLRHHRMLKIGDWIEVPSLGVDGEVKSVSLTSVTIYNWDTTTSIIPISKLHSDHFKNLQNMTDGKTYGRQMLKTFILDTSWFRPLSVEEINRIKDKIKKREVGEVQEGMKKDSILNNLPIDEFCEGVLNARLYRLYIYHWLMNREHVSQQPRLMVRWKEQVEGGLQLQVYAFLTDGGVAAFEWQQSQIIEHIIESLDWFGLRLYQSPSAYDVGNSNIHLTNESATYIKEVSDGKLL